MAYFPKHRRGYGRTQKIQKQFTAEYVIIYYLEYSRYLIFGIGIFMLIGTGILGFVLPVVNAIKAAYGESASYFLTIKFL